jgi:hypothetical protein
MARQLGMQALRTAGCDASVAAASARDSARACDASLHDPARAEAGARSHPPRCVPVRALGPVPRHTLHRSHHAGSGRAARDAAGPDIERPAAPGPSDRRISQAGTSIPPAVRDPARYAFRPLPCPDRTYGRRRVARAPASDAGRAMPTSSQTSGAPASPIPAPGWRGSPTKRASESGRGWALHPSCWP